MAAVFPLPLQVPLVSCPDQLITRLAPLITNVTREDEALSEYRLHGENNYGPDRVTAASFRRELDYCGALWAAQKRFLEGIDPRLGEAFEPLSLHPYIAYVSYVHARLARDPEVRRYYDRYLVCLEAPDARFVWFWEDLHLPAPLGLRFRDQSFDPSKLDQAISFPHEKNVLALRP